MIPEDVVLWVVWRVTLHWFLFSVISETPLFLGGFVFFISELFYSLFRSLCEKVLLVAEYRHIYWQQAKHLCLYRLGKVGRWNSAKDDQFCLVYRPLFPLGHCTLFSSFLLISLPMFLQCELAPSPGLLWHDGNTAGLLIFPLQADLHSSQAKRRGSSDRVCMIFDWRCWGLFVLGVLDEWMWHLTCRPANNF